MPAAHFLTAVDHARIAYDVSGVGPVLVLYYGWQDGRDQWHKLGWVQRLSADFTVITLDLRGCGESDAFDDPARYTPALHLSDLHAVADECGAARFALLGYSWGATVTRNLAALSNRVTRAVMFSTYFGNIFTETFLAELFALYRADPIMAARVQGLRVWIGIEAAALKCPALILTGTADGDVVKVLETQRSVIEAAGITLRVFDGLNHDGLVGAVDTVLPCVQAFLMAD
ncbi:MAG TPA: alpha/beta fold hydrolase [Aggregatilineaceae bacterium]|nr:alpha/beta fold hydrolase [Aggregatilineaceae bacterium]